MDGRSTRVVALAPLGAASVLWLAFGLASAIGAGQDMGAFAWRVLVPGGALAAAFAVAWHALVRRGARAGGLASLAAVSCAAVGTLFLAAGVLLVLSR